MSKKLTGVLFALLLATAFAACGDDDGDVDFRSHNTNYSILVRNNTGERLVAFKGDLRKDTLIGGVPARAQNHGLPNDLALFDKTESFPMILLTEAQYRANIDNLSSLKNTPFTRVFVFFNRQGDNTAVYEIADGLGGNNEFNIINASNSVNVELRLNGVAGETIGFAPAGILDTKLRLHDGNYNIFPVFKRYNAFRDVVETVYPRGTGTGYAWFRTYSFGEGITQATMNLKDILQGLTFQSGAAWVVVNNQTEGGVRFMEGAIVRRTASGLENVMTTRTFQIDMPKLVSGGSNSYADSILVANWRFGPVGFDVPLQAGENDSTTVPSLTILREKMYTITVMGDHNQGNLKAWISSIEDIPTGELGGSW
jgi:hypothetical protein